MVVLGSKTCRAAWWMLGWGNVSVLTGRDECILCWNVHVYWLVDADEPSVRVRAGLWELRRCWCECQPRLDPVIRQHACLWWAAGCVWGIVHASDTLMLFHIRVQLIIFECFFWAQNWPISTTYCKSFYGHNQNWVVRYTINVIVCNLMACSHAEINLWRFLFTVFQNQTSKVHPKLHRSHDF